MKCDEKCLPPYFVCDGIRHCLDGRDEDTEICSKKKWYNECYLDFRPRKCLLTYDHFRYPNIPKYLLEFELNNCSSTVCSPGEYKCQYHGYCIEVGQYCDGIHDCLLGDDETNCG